MRIIKLDATPSTNSFLKAYAKENNYESEWVVVANQQTQGRGQAGSKWVSESGKSLTFSVFKRIDRLDLHEQFFVSMAVSLAVKKVLQAHLVPNLSVKWPNDILSANRKICGILIENCISKGNYLGAVIGVGVNVNESSVKNVPKATSVFIETGVVSDLDALVLEMTQSISESVIELIQNKATIKQKYEDALFQKDKIMTFQDVSGTFFNGIITGVDSIGRLKLQKEDQSFSAYNTKEIRLLY
ncbi:MAG TPA: biotin--[acetyl-CoA-carboxylase] ligase [Flavobacteriaceae bacterium]|nr:biotin--[acetyl-CoA-carboxylase] ligase [Flavobacteriaceae bacterium]